MFLKQEKPKMDDFERKNFGSEGKIQEQFQCFKHIVKNIQVCNGYP